MKFKSVSHFHDGVNSKLQGRKASPHFHKSLPHHSFAEGEVPEPDSSVWQNDWLETRRKKNTPTLLPLVGQVNGTKFMM